MDEIWFDPIKKLTNEQTNKQTIINFTPKQKDGLR